MNQARIDKAREYIGLGGYVTNLGTAKATAAEVVAAYHRDHPTRVSVAMGNCPRAKPPTSSQNSTPKRGH